MIGARTKPASPEIMARERFLAVAPGALLAGSSAVVDAGRAAPGGPPGHAGDADGAQWPSDTRLRGRRQPVDAGDLQFPADVKCA